jgi:hypothetical protein
LFGPAICEEIDISFIACGMLFHWSKSCRKAAIIIGLCGQPVICWFNSWVLVRLLWYPRHDIKDMLLTVRHMFQQCVIVHCAYINVHDVSNWQLPRLKFFLCTAINVQYIFCWTLCHPECKLSNRIKIFFSKFCAENLHESIDYIHVLLFLAMVMVL